MKFSATIPNPYIVGNPLKSDPLFFGREDVFQWLTQAIFSTPDHCAILLYGERRSGKSSILHQIHQGRLGADFLPVLIDMQTLTSRHTGGSILTGLLQELLHQLTASGELLPAPDENFSPTPLLQAFGQFCHTRAREHPRKILLILVDEYEHIRAAEAPKHPLEQWFPIISTLLHPEPRMVFVFTGSYPVPFTHLRLPEHPTFRLMQYDVSFLTPADVHRLITEPVRGYLEFSPLVLRRIYRLTAGHPFYVQVICQTLVDHCNGRRLGYVNTDTLTAVIEEILENPLPHMFYFWNDLSAREQLTLALLADLLSHPDHLLTTEQFRRALSSRPYGFWANLLPVKRLFRELEQRRILYRREGACAFRMDLLRLWIRREKSIWRVMQEVGERLRPDTDDPSRLAGASPVDSPTGEQNREALQAP